MVATEIPQLHWADYLVLALFFVLSAGIGIFHGYHSKKKHESESAKDFLTGGQNMHFVPVAFSMMSSFLSAIFVLGFPAEMYYFGVHNVYLSITYFTAFGLAAHIHLPIYYNLGLTSGYEYLELRFNKAVRTAGAVTFALMVIIYLPVVIYTPSLALAQVTSLPMIFSILSVGAVCTFYTAVGGMKATIWNDALQMTILLACFVVILAIGTAKVGSINDIFDIAREGGRLTTSFDPNPLIRSTFWTHTIGGTFVSLTLYASSQTIIQKFLSTKTVREGQKAVWLSAVINTGCLMMVFILAMIMYAYYRGCDPVAQGRASKTDQLVPLFVMEIMGKMHGLPGLFLATTFSAALSSISGSLNALAAVFLEDLIQPLYYRSKRRRLSSKTAKVISRLLAVAFGIVTIVVSFLTRFFGPTVIQIALSVFGMFGAPLMAILTLGMLVPFVNSWGALTSLVVSLVVTCWVGFGRIILQIPNQQLPVSTENCTTLDNNMTTIAWFTSTAAHDDTTAEPSPERTWLPIYDLSYMYYSVLALLVAIIVALPVSLITGGNKGRELDRRLFFSFRSEGPCCGSKPADDSHEDKVTEPSPDYPLDNVDKTNPPIAYDHMPQQRQEEKFAFTNKSFIDEADLFQPVHKRRDSQFSYRF